MFLKRIIKLFKKGNVCVTGLRGSGKDMLMSNVIVRRKEDYISNINYNTKNHYYKLDLKELAIKNNYKNFITGYINPYFYSYPKGIDIYVSDVGVYFPSQYCGELNRDYKEFPGYMALSRQISHNNFHINVQNLNRAWDKIREQSDTYIMCNWCKVIGKIVIQKVTIYEKYESCLNRVRPCRVKVPLLANRETRMRYRMHIDQFLERNGKIKTKYLIYINKSNYDTYYFEKLLENRLNEYENNY